MVLYYMQDNDPKHMSGYADQSMQNNVVNWWKTPVESPDLNSIDYLCPQMLYISEVVVR